MENPIIVALDNVDQLEKLQPLVETLAPHVGMFKVGLELSTRFGAPYVVDFVHKCGGRVFLDLKFNDIPNTVQQATKAAVSLGVEMFNVHASSGAEAMRAAASEKGNSKMLVVTVLTSLNAKALFELGHLIPLFMVGVTAGALQSSTEMMDTEYVPALVKQLAILAANCGADGLISSPKELKILNSAPETKGLLKVTPGVRPAWADVNDQKRVMTPAEAMLAGANYLVIGRPITKAKDRTPVEAAKNILWEINETLESQSTITEMP